MAIYSDDAAVRARGRPSVAVERHRQIVNGFIELVAERDSAAVSLGDVAQHSGVARTAIRHFVGNRTELIEHAVVELTTRYRAMIDAAVGPEPHPEHLVAMLFDDGWVRSRPSEDRAFDALAREAANNSNIRELVAGAFGHLVDTISTAFDQHGAPGPKQELDNAAYAIVCLSEHNVALQALGFDPERSKGAATAALNIVSSTLNPSTTSAIER